MSETAPLAPDPLSTTDRTDRAEKSERPEKPERSSIFSRIANRLKPRNGDNGMREALEGLIETREGGDEPLDDHEQTLLSNVLRLRAVTAYEIMVPRADISAIDGTSTVSQAAAMLVETGHSRAPVYRATLDDVVGMVHVKDLTRHLLAQADKETDTNTDPAVAETSLVRKVLIVSPSIRVLDLLLDMRLKRTHMALVVDEYGGIDGLVTIEDLVEQIVGEIEDEHDDEQEPELTVKPDGSVIASARVELKDFEERFGKAFSDEERDEIDTLGGLVFSLCGRVPDRSELIQHPSGLEFEVMDADPRRIRRLRIFNLDAVTPPAPDEPARG